MQRGHPVQEVAVILEEAQRQRQAVYEIKVGYKVKESQYQSLYGTIHNVLIM